MINDIPEPVDRRKGYDGLFEILKTGLGRDPARYLREAVRAADRGEVLLPRQLAATAN